MKNRYLACAIAATALAGCSSALSLRDSTPTAVYQGDGSAEEVASCVSDAWATKPVKVTMNQQYTGTTIQLQQTEGGPVVALVDVKPVGATVVAKYYSNFQEDDSWYFERVRDCVLTTHAHS
ncbi:hypothetical protein EZM97_16710 [Dyella soli]|uniref:Lipoprotein n=1 Tax=Dyella soli TaxID=522319 RepID=A0A4R0YVY1_9GAMM|nr:hypothetical protein [Dyella soli]TCI10510.1 hypothetical protein EZM97_16710 [Dyella soli]